MESKSLFHVYSSSPLPTPLDPVQSTLPHTFRIVYDNKDSNMKDAKLQSIAFAMFSRFWVSSSTFTTPIGVVTLMWLQFSTWFASDNPDPGFPFIFLLKSCFFSLLFLSK